MNKSVIIYLYKGEIKMKKIKVLLSLFLFTFFFSLISKPSVVNADMGPKPASYVTIKGIEGDYVACFAAKEAGGPNIDYETWLEYKDYPEEYNPIMEYKDDEGFKWITRYYMCNGEEEISFTYYCPSVYKIVIYQNNEFLIATDALEMYAYSTYYEIDFSSGTIVSKDNIKVTNTYDYFKEISNLVIRVILTLAIEIGIFYLFRLYTKRNFYVVLIVNLLTQIFLNVTVNVTLYTSGSLSAMLLLFSLEFIILLIELIAYQMLLKDKKRWVIIIYSLVANILSFGCGFLIFKLL